MNKLSSKYIGNQKIYDKILNLLIQSYLPQSIIIYGSKGIGKSTLVHFLVSNCFSKLSTNDILQNNLIYNNTHPNFYYLNRELDPVSKKIKKNITVDQIRNLESFIYQSSLNQLPKIVLIDNTNDLNINSSNALLKILEEPKFNTYFFLISHQISLLLPTIRSRCIKFYISKPSFESFSIILKDNDSNISSTDIKILYDLSEASPGVAINIYKNGFNDFFNKIVDIFKENKNLSSKILELSSELSILNNDQFKSFISIISFILLNVIKINIGADIKNYLLSNISDVISELNNSLNFNNCIKAIDYIEKNQKNLFLLNLDKKIFTINLFSEISNN